ncbi:MAG: ABC transporter ATP-binding protein, partial [Candidatus Thorarchaeota archaeon]
IIQRMNDDELIRLARVLRVPIASRIVKRSWLVEELTNEMEVRSAKRTEGTIMLSDPAIEIKNMTKKFGKKIAVDKLNLTVSPGEIVGLVGPNGAGKTTTLRVITGIIKATSGDVSVGGFDIRKSPIPAKSMIGYIPEKPTCYPSLTVREYLMFMGRIYDVPTDEVIIRMSEYVDKFQLHEYIDNYIGTLSKGNLQRTLLVGIFVRKPPFVLAFDEPIYGLDPRGAWSLKSHLQHLKADGSAILVSTHILEVAERLCDRFVIMNEAKIVGRGTLEELLDASDKATNLEEVFLELTGGIPENS